jgi:nucleoid-associated protein YgaU
MKRNSTIVNYQKLLLNIVREKYFNLVLGMAVSLLVSSLIYKQLAKNFTFKLTFSLPKITPASITKSNKVANQPKTYVVQEGDDLWHIAEKFYGSGFNAYDISLANNINADSPIEKGQKLKIPDVKRRESTVGEISSVSTSKITYTEGKYVVQPGDSLSLIAYRVFGDLNSWPKLLQSNNLLSADQIEVGMVLTIPR